MDICGCPRPLQAYKLRAKEAQKKLLPLFEPTEAPKEAAHADT